MEFVGGCGSTAISAEMPTTGLEAQADANRFIILAIGNFTCTSGTFPSITGVQSDWIHPETDCGDSHSNVAGSGSCAPAAGALTSPNGTSCAADVTTCQTDAYLIQRVISDAETRFDIDPARIWGYGGSTGGSAAREYAICDSRTDTLFRGEEQQGAGIQELLGNTTGISCPGLAAADELHLPDHWYRI